MSFDIADRYAKYIQYQSVTWECRTGYDGEGKPSFTAGVSINVRRVRKHKLVRDASLLAKSNEVISDTVYMVTADVNAEDKIDDVSVITTEEANDLQGNTVGKLVYL